MSDNIYDDKFMKDHYKMIVDNQDEQIAGLRTRIEEIEAVCKALFDAFANEYHYRHEVGMGQQEIDRMQTSAMNNYRAVFPE